jgi:hypothetical protein
MKTLALLTTLAASLALAGCYAGPGHTRAAGAAVGTGTGAVMGAMIGSGSGDAGTGAVLGGILGYVAGSTVGEGIAQDQEMYNSPRHIGGDRIEAGCAQPAPPCRVVRRRRYYRPRRVVIYEEVIEEPCAPYCGP